LAKGKYSSQNVQHSHTLQQLLQLQFMQRLSPAGEDSMKSQSNVAIALKKTMQ
jgi:hypothetical protein